MTPKLVVFLAIGTLMMGLPIIFVAKKYEIRIWKACAGTLLLTIFGATGTLLMYYFENGKFGGLSFYGAVFLVPVAFIVISLILQIPYGKIMDLCAIGECIMLALMKVHCILGGCCLGRVLFTTDSGVPVLFPSREAEMAVAIILFAILLQWALRKKRCGQLYAWYLVLYGGTRFVLNIFREAWVDREMFLPYGNIWSLVALAIGTTWLILLWGRREKKH